MTLMISVPLLVIAARSALLISKVRSPFCIIVPDIAMLKQQVSWIVASLLRISRSHHTCEVALTCRAVDRGDEGNNFVSGRRRALLGEPDCGNNRIELGRIEIVFKLLTRPHSSCRGDCKAPWLLGTGTLCCNLSDGVRRAALDQPGARPPLIRGADLPEMHSQPDRNLQM